MSFRQSLLIAAAALASTTAAHAGEIYGAVGLPGVILGYAHPVNDAFTVRADFSTLGTHTGREKEEGIDYDGKLKTDRVGLFADYFVWGGLRVTGGVTFNNIKMTLNAQGNGTPLTIGNTTFVATADDRFNVTVEFPKTTPYIGFGYGHQKSERGLGFTFDIGASIGKAKVTETHSGANLNAAVSQADIDKELAELRDGVGKVKVIPQISIGLNYRF